MKKKKTGKTKTIQIDSHSPSLDFTIVATHKSDDDVACLEAVAKDLKEIIREKKEELERGK